MWWISQISPNVLPQLTLQRIDVLPSLSLLCNVKYAECYVSLPGAIDYWLKESHANVPVTYHGGLCFNWPTWEWEIAESLQFTITIVWRKLSQLNLLLLWLALKLKHLDQMQPVEVPNVISLQVSVWTKNLYHIWCHHIANILECSPYRLQEWNSKKGYFPFWCSKKYPTLA